MAGNVSPVAPGFSYTETGVPQWHESERGGNPFASFLLGYVDSGSLDTVRFIGQQWPYFAGYFQDDWRVTSKLVLNLGLRWETTLPPTGLNDGWSDFSPTTPNPGAGGRPGAVIFAGSGSGRVGSRSLADSYFGAFGPHVGFAYSKDSKTVVRGSYARSFGAITTVSGLTHAIWDSLFRSLSAILREDCIRPFCSIKACRPGRLRRSSIVPFRMALASPGFRVKKQPGPRI